MYRVAILGGGGMGTAMALVLARAGAEVRLWVREPDRAAPDMRRDPQVGRLRQGRDAPGLGDAADARDRRLDDVDLLAATVALALLGNAFLCGVISGPHDRYGARMVWIAVFVVLIAIERFRARATNPTKDRISAP